MDKKEHILIRKTRSLLLRSKPDSSGLLWPGVQGLNIFPTKGTMARALQLFAQLIHMAETEGVRFDIREGKGTVAVWLDQPVTIRLKELLHRVPHVPTAYERDSKKRDPKYQSHIKYDLASTGRLSIQINDGSGSAYFRVDWKDGKLQGLEDQLDEIITTLKYVAEMQVREQEQRKVNQERNKASAAAEFLERERRERLDKLLEQWRKAKEISLFLSEIEVSIAQVGVPLTVEQTSYLEWARKYGISLMPKL